MAASVTVFLETQRYHSADVPEIPGANQGEIEYGLDLADWIRARG